MDFITMMLAALISILPAPVPSQECGSDCIGALTAAVEWALAKAPSTTAHSDPKRTALDIEPRWPDRPPGAISIEEEVATLRQIAQRLGVEMVERSEDDASQTCRKSLTSPACRPHWGRTIIKIERFHFTSTTQAEVEVDIEVLGDRMLGGSGGPYHSSLYTELKLQKGAVGWKVAGLGLTIVS